jgi:hypothetical protein
VLIFTNLNNIAEQEAIGPEDQQNTLDLRKSGTKASQHAAALPPLQIGGAKEEID